MGILICYNYKIMEKLVKTKPQHFMWMITAPKTILLFLKTEIKLEYSFLERNKVKPSTMNMIVIVL